MSADPLAPLPIVLIGGACRDPALDPEMDLEAYARERDPALIREQPGAKALRFVVGKISRPFMLDVVDSCERESSRNMMAFMAACHAYEDAAGNVHKATLIDGAYKQRL